MWNTGLDEAQTGIKIARRNVSNLRYADGTTLIAESREELKSLLIGAKEGVRIIKKIHMNNIIQKKRYILYFYFESTDSSDQISYIKTVMDFHVLFELDNKA